MEATNKLKLPYIMNAQAQKHVVHNEALRLLDGMVQLSVKSRSQTTPPRRREEGDCYIVPADATGAWQAKISEIAMFADGAWIYLTPNQGWMSWISDENGFFVFNNGNWSAITELLFSKLVEIQNLPLAGINATADETNRLSLSSTASLFSHNGAGHQLKINKSDVSQTAAVLFQDRYSGKAEIGLAGDNSLSIKVSKDENDWKNAINVDPGTGTTSFDYPLIARNFEHRPRDLDQLNILYVDPDHGSDSNDGKSVSQAFATLGGLTGNWVQGKRLVVRLLGDLHMRETISFHYPVPGIELCGWSGSKNRQSTRKLHVHNTSVKPAVASGFLFHCPASVKIEHLEVELRASSKGMFLSFVDTSGFVASVNVALTRTPGAQCKMIGNGTSFVPSMHQALRLSQKARGYLLEGVEAEADPNRDWRYPCNLTAA